MSGWVSLEISSREIHERVLDTERRAATQASDVVERLLEQAAKDLGRTCEYIPFEHFPPDELAQALRIPYEQLGWATAVALLDATGRPLAPPARRLPNDKGPTDRETVSASDLKKFADRVPLRAALESEEAVGAPYLSSSGAPRISLARSFPVAAGQDRWVLAVEVSLSDAQSMLMGLAPGHSGIAYLVDGQGTLLTHPHHEWAKARRSIAKQPATREGMAGHTVATGHYVDLAGHEVVGAFAPVPALQGGVVLEQHADEAFAAIGRLRTAALLWTLVALGLAALGALYLSRGVTAPVGELASAARAVERGDYDKQLRVHSRDELGMLAETFNRMSEEVRAKQEEITAWNRELAARVEERTGELREARDQVVRSEKLAATAELAAGVAHELNNPLTGILGLGQVLLQDCTNGVRGDLEEIVRQAQRMRTTIANLTRFARPAEQTDRQTFNLNRVVGEAVAINRDKMIRHRVDARVDCASDLLDVEGNPDDLLLALLHLMTNAIQAMPKGGTITLQTRVVDHSAVKLLIADTGVGIEPDRLSRIFEPFYTDRAVGYGHAGGGLGLPVAHRIVEEHQGRIAISSQPGQGTSFTLFFPGLRRNLHLR